MPRLSNTTETDDFAAIAAGSARRDPRYTAAEYGPDKLLSLVRLADARSIACERWFDGLPLRREQLADPDLRVSYRTAHQFICRAMRELDLPNAGLVIGREGDIGDFGLLGLAMLTSRTLGEALAAAMENYHVCGCLLDLAIEPAGAGELAMVASVPFDDVELEPFFCEELFASCINVTRKLSGSAFRPLRLELRYPAPAHADEYAQLFGCPLRFGASRNRMLFETRWLDHPLSGHNPLTTSQALALCAQRLAPEHAVPRQEIVVAVERLLRERLDQHPRLADVARVLNLSERTLRRKLAESGQVFRDLYDSIRAEHATQLLLERRLSVAEVGVKVGFDDPREFRRAFKRWTGMVPKMARGGAVVQPAVRSSVEPVRELEALG
jgi:AraC-like DNA-binding protein